MTTRWRSMPASLTKLVFTTICWAAPTTSRSTAKPPSRTAGPSEASRNSRHAVRANRRFLGRAVRYLAAEVGIQQFLEIGSGIPTVNNVHHVAQNVAPESRVAYVDYDTVAIAHAHTLLKSSPKGATAHVQSDLRDSEHILAEAAATLDLDQPVAVLLVSMLHFFPDRENPYGIVGQYFENLAPGSHLVLSHMAKDIQPEAIDALAEPTASDDTIAYTFHPRTNAEIATSAGTCPRQPRPR